MSERAYEEILICKFWRLLWLKVFESFHSFDMVKGVLPSPSGLLWERL